MRLWETLRTWARFEPREATEVTAEARSHVGHVRTINEDRLLSRTDRGFWAVADGMGGHQGGVTAASIAIGALEEMANASVPLDDDCVLATLQHANKMIHALEKPSGVSGATIVAARRDGDAMVIYWAGDSRAYLAGGAKAQLVSHDHSFVQELVDAGILTKEEARDHPKANVITRALGVARHIEIETVRVPFRSGDTILLCSDGVSRSLTMKDLTAPSPSTGYSADRLLKTALQRDGTDNATLVLIERRS